MRLNEPRDWEACARDRERAVAAIAGLEDSRDRKCKVSVLWRGLDSKISDLTVSRGLGGTREQGKTNVSGDVVEVVSFRVQCRHGISKVSGRWSQKRATRDARNLAILGGSLSLCRIAVA